MQAQKRQANVGAVVALPSVSEGQQVCRNAVAAFQELVAAKVSPLIVIDNDAVDEIYSPPMSKLLSQSNLLISSLLDVFNQLAATKSEHITFDKAELLQLLMSGIVVMGSADIDTTKVKSPADISAAIKSHITQSVLARVNMATGRNAACIFVASPEVLDNYSQAYFSAGFDMINRIVGSAHPEGTDVVIHRGVYSQAADGLQCYVMVSGTAGPNDKIASLIRTAKLPAATLNAATHLKVE
jgi:cell division GTPase FtsZ